MLCCYTYLVACTYSPSAHLHVIILQEEDIALLLSHAEVGNRWAIIAKRCPGRTKLQVRDRWRTLQKPAHAAARQRVEAMIEAGQGFDESRSWASSAQAKVDTNKAHGSVPVMPGSEIVADIGATGAVPVASAASHANSIGFASTGAGVGTTTGVGTISVAGGMMPGVVPIAGATTGDIASKHGDRAQKRQRTHRRTLSGEAAAALVSLAAAAALMGEAAPPKRPPVLQDISSHDSTKSLLS